VLRVAEPHSGDQSQSLKQTSLAEPVGSATDSTGATAARLSGWYQEYLPDVRRVLRRKYRLQKSELEDVCQELFVRLLEYGVGSGIDNPRAYILRAAENVLRNIRGRAQQRLPHQPEWLEHLVEDGDQQPEQLLERAREVSAVSGAIRLLSSRQQRLIDLHFRHGLSYKERRRFCANTSCSYLLMLALRY
jgi:RNA polymerase sigma factor (sigma-70 family)